MKTIFMTVGKTTDRHLAALLADYAARVAHYVPFSVEVVPDVRGAGSLTPDQQKEREADATERMLRAGDYLVLLDERGRELTSEEFARDLSQRLQGTARRLVFLAGGAYGFAPRIYKRAQGMLSLSRMTLPHQLARLLFAEQFYRAMTILRGEPYHHA